MPGDVRSPGGGDDVPHQERWASDSIWIRARLKAVSIWGIDGKVSVRDGECAIVVTLAPGSEVERPVATMDELDEVVTEFKIPAGRQSVVPRRFLGPPPQRDLKLPSPEASQPAGTLGS